jgi:hypothetical protein
MGSHGGATAQGQTNVLAGLGIQEATMGCPIVSSLEVVAIGRTPDGIDVCVDRHAFESDGVMPIARVKWHTNYDGPIESGLCKMLAVGFGKLAGAERYHIQAYTRGLGHVVRSAARQVLQSGKVLGGLAVLEDAYHRTAQVTAVPAEALEQKEEELLALVKSWMGRIPVPLDVLIVDRIGKDISGAGMDTKVVNRGSHGEPNPWPGAPRIARIFVRDLSPHSYGNAIGIGLADVLHDRILPKIDWQATSVNALTASNPEAIRTPIHFATDRECLERIAPTAGKADFSELTYGWITSSLELETLRLSENLQDAIRQHPLLEIDGPAQPMEFDEDGNLSPTRQGDSVNTDTILT